MQQQQNVFINIYIHSFNISFKKPLLCTLSCIQKILPSTVITSSKPVAMMKNPSHSKSPHSYFFVHAFTQERDSVQTHKVGKLSGCILFSKIYIRGFLRVSSTIYHNHIKLPVCSRVLFASIIVCTLSCKLLYVWWALQFF